MMEKKISVSIVIPSYNGKKLLERHLPAVVAALDYWQRKQGGRGELVVVDDASTDGTSDWLREKYPEIRVVRNSRNLRFGQSCNRGVEVARGKVVVLLNNDVEPERDFLLNLLSHFPDDRRGGPLAHTSREVFAVGCREENSVSGRKALGGRGVSAFRRGLVVHWRPEDQESAETSWVSAGSAAYRRDVWRKLGGFDRLFRPAYEEDRDLCWQAQKAGYRLVFEPRSVVKHSHETTNVAVFGERKIKLYSMKNQLLFVWKNISSSKLLFQHLFWLPYHLTVTCLKTKGIFFLGFVLALGQLPEAVKSRVRVARNWKKKDEEVLSGVRY